MTASTNIAITVLPAAVATEDWGISDDPLNGTTTAYFHAGAMVPWENMNGDWIDANGVSQGPVPVSSFASVRQDTPQTLSFDLTAHAQAGKRFEFRMDVVGYPRTLASTLGVPPILTVHYADGTTSAAAAIVASSIGGGSSAVQPNKLWLTGGSVGILRFPRPPAGVIASAIITVPGVDAHWTADSVVQLFLIRRPNLIATGPVELGIAQGFVLDANIKSDPRVLFSLDLDRPWAELFLDKGPDWTNGLRYDWTGKDQTLYPQISAGRIVSGGPGDDQPLVVVDQTETLAGFLPRDPRISKVLRVHLPAGDECLSDRLMFFKPTATGDQNLPIDPAGKLPQKMYVRSSVRLGTNFFVPAGSAHNGGKWWPGFAHRTTYAGNGGAYAHGNDGWSCRGQFILPNTVRDPLFQKRMLWGTYQYNKFMNQNDIMYGAGGALKLAQWYDIEVGMVMNTPGVANGQLRAWVDGIKVFEKTDFWWRDDPAISPYLKDGLTGVGSYGPVADMGILMLWWNDWFGGIFNTDQDVTYHMSNIVVASDPIGPVRFQ